MKRFLIAALSVIALTSGSVLLPSTPSMAESNNVKEYLNQLPKTRVKFPPGKSSTTIQGGEDRIYIFRARKGQKLTFQINNLGARASVTLYGVDGEQLSPAFGAFNGNGKTFSVNLTKTGDYYIIGGSGPSNHIHNFTVTIK